MVDDLYAPRAFYPQGGERRSFARDSGYEGDKDLGALPAPAEGVTIAQASCPGSILDSAPGGGGLGVWVLVGEDDDSCTYEYGGGIA